LGDGALGHLLDEIHPGRALPEALAAPGRARALLAGGIPGHGFRIWLTIVRRAPRAAKIGGSSVFAWRTNAAASVLSNRQTLLEHHAGARPEFLALALKLAAGGENVAAARRAHRARVAGVEHDLREALDSFPVRAFVSASRPGIERDEVDLGGQTLQEAHQGSRLGQRIVDALQHRIFEGNAPRVRG